MNEQYKIVGRDAGMRADMDFYPTPEYITRALMDRIKFAGTIWECACGNGKMSEVLKTYGNHVVSTDLIDRGYYDATTGVDFLMEFTKMENIVTNPPFNLAYEFIEKGLMLAEKKLALLLPIRYLTGKKRCELYRKTPPAFIIVIPNKVDFVGNSNPVMEFAWFVWDKTAADKTTQILWADYYGR
jgi:hypothetical protein